MIITRNPDALDLPPLLDLSQGTSVTVGNFDGVHLGHQALLAMTQNARPRRERFLPP